MDLSNFNYQKSMGNRAKGRGRGRGRGGRSRGRGKRVTQDVESEEDEVHTPAQNSSLETNKKEGGEEEEEEDDEAPKFDMDADISQLEAPTFTTINRGPPEPMLRLRWDHKVNLIGEKVMNPMIHGCDICKKPILIYGRMIPCKHVFCLVCSKLDDQICPRCGDSVLRVEQSGLGTVFMCTFGGTRYGNSGCRRTYLSQRDLQAHINHRHMALPAAPNDSAGKYPRVFPNSGNIQSPVIVQPDTATDHLKTGMQQQLRVKTQASIGDPRIHNVSSIPVSAPATIVDHHRRVASQQSPPPPPPLSQYPLSHHHNHRSMMLSSYQGSNAHSSGNMRTNLITVPIQDNNGSTTEEHSLSPQSSLPYHFSPQGPPPSQYSHYNIPPPVMGPSRQQQSPYYQPQHSAAASVPYQSSQVSPHFIQGLPPQTPQYQDPNLQYTTPPPQQWQHPNNSQQFYR